MSMPMHTRRRLHECKRERKPPRLNLKVKQILATIHDFNGMASLKQLDRLFFSGSSWTAERLFHFFDAGWLNYADMDGERVYWLTKAGASLVATYRQTTLAGMGWKEKKIPKLQLHHDLQVNDLRIRLDAAIEGCSLIATHTYIPEGVFRQAAESVTLYAPTGEEQTKHIYPDLTLLLTLKQQPKLSRVYLIELDCNSNKPTNTVIRQKVPKGVAYLKSRAFQQRFAARDGRWLVVTTSDERARNMQQEALRAGGRRKFYFTSKTKIMSESFLTAPIWCRTGSTEPLPLLVQQTPILLP